MFLPVVGFFIGFIALLPLLVWYVLVGGAFFKLGRARVIEPRTADAVRRELVAPTHRPADWQTSGRSGEE